MGNFFNTSRARKFHFLKYKNSFLLGEYKKSFLLRKYKHFFNIWARKFHFRKYKESFSGGFLKFFWFGMGSAACSSISYYCPCASSIIKCFEDIEKMTSFQKFCYVFFSKNLYINFNPSQNISLISLLDKLVIVTRRVDCLQVFQIRKRRVYLL